MTVLEAGELPLLRLMGRQIASGFADLHCDHGVDPRLAAQVAEIIGENRTAAGVRLAPTSTTWAWSTPARPNPVTTTTWSSAAT
ncbi:hypothetical protein [Streptomyces lydicus]|uniref:hypothetical protein n=1 Tax=Streptomyces lydicus TaxID=47763 RepID=UPI00286FD411|nr:hypothetical protein [Streptomyces lydicus]